MGNHGYKENDIVVESIHPSADEGGNFVDITRMLEEDNTAHMYHLHSKDNGMSNIFKTLNSVSQEIQASDITKEDAVQIVGILNEISLVVVQKTSQYKNHDEDSLPLTLSSEGSIKCGDKKHFDWTINDPYTNLANEEHIPPPLPKKEDVVCYIRRTDAYEHLKKHWGLWLKCFNPKLKKDYLYQYKLQELDSVLLRAFINQCKYGKKSELCGKKTADFLPPKEQELDAELEESSSDEIKKATRLRNTSTRRKIRGQQAVPG